MEEKKDVTSPLFCMPQLLKYPPFNSYINLTFVGLTLMEEIIVVNGILLQNYHFIDNFYNINLLQIMK